MNCFILNVMNYSVVNNSLFIDVRDARMFQITF